MEKYGKINYSQIYPEFFWKTITDANFHRGFAWVIMNIGADVLLNY
ncbi:MAG TPA: hypothetical protein IGS52_19725 [Oscillatoriaceae cyanobacterium M33_DOE_052]|nr:hypothetical protein [Oscillatoriaceae cyanobacterium M33_DOE_052]